MGYVEKKGGLPCACEFLGTVLLLPAAAVAGCPRPVAGIIVSEPPSLYSQDGELKVDLN